MTNVNLPHHFIARDYQVPFLRAVEKAIRKESDIRYFFQVWHRRSGKDKTNIADVVPRQLIQFPCLVKYVYPTLVMGRDNMWDGIGSDGFKYMNHIPESIRAGSANEGRMKVPVRNREYDPESKNYSIFQIAGSDRPDSLRGGNPQMFIFSEWADQDPYAWDVVEPILRENDGIAIFNTTPKGDNHARALYEYAKTNPKWHVELLTAEDTKIFSQQEVLQIKTDIIKRFEANGRSVEEATAYFEQEYMCSFKSPIVGAYYGAGLRRAEREGRITNVPSVMRLPVHTAWDLGMDDSMSIWFYQILNMEIRFIDYYENSGEGIEFYVKKLQEKDYVYGKHFGPHDIKVRELGTGKSRWEVAKSLGITFQVAPRLEVMEGINAGRSIFNQCWFDADKCSRGINALRNYKKDWDENNKVFRNQPKHDWASHGCLVGDSLILTIKGEKRIDEVEIGDMVWTPCGYSNVLNVGITKFVDELFNIRTTKGILRCTRDHRFFTNRGLVYADALRHNDIIWNQKYHRQLNLMGLFIGYRKVQTIIDLVLEGLKKNCIVKYGSFIMAKFLRVLLFIIKIVINLITKLKIWFVFLLRIIINFILTDNMKIILIGINYPEQEIASNMLLLKKTKLELRHYSQKRWSKQNCGISQMKVKSGIVSMLRIYGRIEFLIKKNVSIVKKYIKHFFLKGRSGVARVVKLEQDAVNNIPVYDLTIKKHQCYLANGLLVSNSDAFRTFAVTYKEQIKRTEIFDPGGVKPFFENMPG